MVWLWLALGIVLLAVEVWTNAFFAVFIGAGCFAAALAAQGQGSLLVEVLVGAAVALAGAVVARPLLLDAVRRRAAARTSDGLEGLVGRRALTADLVGDENHPGHVMLGGERWLAVSDGAPEIGAEIPVTVVAVRGTTLLVRPPEAGA